MDFKQWEGFDKSGKWIDEINVRNFIQKTIHLMKKIVVS